MVAQLQLHFVEDYIYFRPTTSSCPPELNYPAQVVGSIVSSHVWPVTENSLLTFLQRSRNQFLWYESVFCRRKWKGQRKFNILWSGGPLIVNSIAITKIAFRVNFSPLSSDHQQPVQWPIYSEGNLKGSHRYVRDVAWTRIQEDTGRGRDNKHAIPSIRSNSHCPIAPAHCLHDIPGRVTTRQGKELANVIDPWLQFCPLQSVIGMSLDIFTDHDKSGRGSHETNFGEFFNSSGGRTRFGEWKGGGSNFKYFTSTERAKINRIGRPWYRCIISATAVK